MPNARHQRTRDAYVPTLEHETCACGRAADLTVAWPTQRYICLDCYRMRVAMREDNAPNEDWLWAV